MLRLNVNQNLELLQAKLLQKDKDDYTLFSIALTNLNNVFYHLLKHFCFEVNFYKLLIVHQSNRQKYELIF